MLSFNTDVDVHSVNVFSSNDGGLSTEQIAQLSLDRLLLVADNAPPVIKEQAEAFKENLRIVLFQTIELSRREERATIAHKMSKAGQKEMADLVRRL
jgi:hypothetical protein|tara:strand:+ start:227 stop:517 length:291 start_codon:yes stop_codon:yes gene_type:complete